MAAGNEALKYRDLAPGDVWSALEELYAWLEEDFPLDRVSRERRRERLEARFDEPEDWLPFAEAAEELAAAHPRQAARAARTRERLDALYRDWAARRDLDDARRRLIEIDVELRRLDLWSRELDATKLERAVVEGPGARGSAWVQHGDDEPVPVVVSRQDRERAMRRIVACDRKAIATRRRQLFAARALLGLTIPRRSRLTRARGDHGRARARPRRTRGPPTDDERDPDPGDPGQVGRRRRGWAP